MTRLKKKRGPAPRRRRLQVKAIAGPFLIRGEKIQITSLNGRAAAGTHLPKNGFPTLQALERDYIKKVLSHVSENRTRAAAILGIDRVSLWRKMKQYQIVSAVSRSLEA